MGFISRLFGKKPLEKTVLNQSNNLQPATNNNFNSNIKINYKPELIDSLKNDHQKLFEIYGDLVNYASTNDFLKIPHKLNELKLALQGHVLVENVHFYVYVQEKHKNDLLNSEFIKDVRREMNTIAKVVVDFVKKYQMKQFNNEVKVGFLEELTGIGEALTQRVEMEESKLYTLYFE